MRGVRFALGNNCVITSAGNHPNSNTGVRILILGTMGGYTFKESIKPLLRFYVIRHRSRSGERVFGRSWGIINDRLPQLAILIEFPPPTYQI